MAKSRPLMSIEGDWTRARTSGTVSVPLRPSIEPEIDGHLGRCGERDLVAKATREMRQCFFRRIEDLIQLHIEEASADAESETLRSCAAATPDLPCPRGPSRRPIPPGD